MNCQDIRPMRAIAVLLGVVALLGVSFGQVNTAEVRGIVTDPSGALVAAAAVVAKNTATGIETRTATDERGNYALPALQPGSYEIRVQKDGFRPEVRQGVQLTVAQVARLDFRLEVGAERQEITVTAPAPLLDIDNPEVGNLIQNRQILDLPLNGRNPYQLAELAPGVQPEGGFYVPRVFGEQTFQSNFKVNGGASLTNEILINGTTNVVAGQGNLAYTPPIDALQEFRIMSSNFSSEFGRTGGGVVNIVTKSGTNSFHGSLYEFHRDDRLDANNFYNNRTGTKKQPFVYNNFGFSAGGPILVPGAYDGRNKSFWFFAYEGYRVRQSQTFLGRVPTLLERTGDFSQTLVNGQPVKVFLPFGGGFVASGQLPSSAIDPVALKVAAFFPPPNFKDPIGVNNFVATPRVSSDLDTFLVRFDHNFSSTNHALVEFGRDKVTNTQGNPYNNIATNGTGEFNQSPNYHASIGDTHIFGARTVLNVRYGFARNEAGRSPVSKGFDFTSIGFPSNLNNLLERRFPIFFITGYSAIGNSIFGTFKLGSDVHSLNGTVTRVQGSHTITTGAEARLYRYNSYTGFITAGEYFFQGGFTGQPLVDFLTGVGFGFTGILPSISTDVHYYAAFVQDSYRVTRKFTVNLGARYSYESPRSERFDRQSFFDPNVPNPVGAQMGIPDLKGGLRFAGVNGTPRGWSRPDFNDIAPGVGFAYNFLPKTVLRGGYAITYLPNQTARNCCGYGQDGYSAFSIFFSFAPSVRLQNPFPNGLTQPSGSSKGLSTALGGSIFGGHTYDESVPYSQNWNLGLQHELPGGIVVEASYVGTRGVHLPITIRLNQLDPKFFSLGTSLNDQVPNPLAKVLSGQSATTPRWKTLRPFPQFDDITDAWTQIGSSTYHSFTLRAEKRMSNNLLVSAAFTGAKLISDIFSDKDFTGDIQANVQNSHDLSQERSLDPNDVSRHFVASYVYQLPFGKGQRWMSGANPVWRQIAGGWRTAGVIRYQTGNPLTFTVPADPNRLMGALVLRPNIIGDPTAVNQNIDHWFSTAAFANPGPIGFGNASRTLSNVRGPSSTQIDFSVLKDFTVTEAVKLEFRAEFFNLLNHPVFGLPGTTFGTPQFGVISSQANAPRQVQLGLKLYW